MFLRSKNCHRKIQYYLQFINFLSLGMILLKNQFLETIIDA